MGNVVTTTVVFIIKFVLAIYFNTCLNTSTMERVTSNRAFRRFIRRHFPGVNFSSKRAMGRSRARGSVLPSKSTLRVSTPCNSVGVGTSSDARMEYILGRTGSDNTGLSLSSSGVVLSNNNDACKVTRLAICLPGDIALLAISGGGNSVSVSKMGLGALAVGSISKSVSLSSVATREKGVGDSTNRARVSRATIFAGVLRIGRDFNSVRVSIPESPSGVGFVVSSRAPLSRGSAYSDCLLSLTQDASSGTRCAMGMGGNRLSMGGSSG